MDVETNPVVVTGTTVDVTEPTGQLFTEAAQEVIVYDFVTEIVEVIGTAGALVAGAVVAGADVATEETGQTVVDTAIVSVVTFPIWAGQFVTVGAHAVTV